MTTTKEEYGKRVDAGIEWLDRYAPEWRLLVIPSELDMSDLSDCILGQTFGQFGFIHDSILGDSEVVSLGFDIKDCGESHLELGNVWRKKLCSL